MNIDGTISFTLHGVLNNGTSSEQTSKFVSRSRKKTNVKIQTFTEDAGKKLRVAYTGNVLFEGETELPENVCFWDHEPYDTPLICIPLQYSVVNGIHKFKGIKSFCRLPCMYKFLLELEKLEVRLRPVWLKTAFQLIKIAAVEMYGKDYVLIPSDHYEFLKKYGGPKTLEELRKETDNKIYLRTPNVQFAPMVETHILQLFLKITEPTNKPITNGKQHIIQ